jgi:hypothetical protein
VHELVLLPHRGWVRHEVGLGILEKLLTLSWVHHLGVDHPWVSLFILPMEFVI